MCGTGSGFDVRGDFFGIAKGGSALEVIVLRRKNRNNGTCVFAAILLFFGLVCLCFVSYRFLLFLAAGIMIVIGIILIRRC